MEWFGGLLLALAGVSLLLSALDNSEPIEPDWRNENDL